MSIASSPLPPLPLEVKGHVLRFCDQQTLGRTSQASLAFLELSIPILHDEIHIDGFDMLEKMLCCRLEFTSSAVEALLSFRHVRSFTLADSTDQRPHLARSSCNRCANGSNIPVGRLNLALSAEHHAGTRWSQYLPLFDPEVVNVMASEDKYTRPVYNIELRTAPWHRLRTLVFDSSTSTFFLGASAMLHSRLEPGVVVVPLIVVYDISSIRANDKTDIYGDISDDLSSTMYDVFAPSSRLGGIIVRVGTEDQLAKFKASLQLYLDHNRLDLAQRNKRWDKIKFEVV